MTEFIAFDPNAEVRGLSILTVLAHLGKEAHAILQKHGMSHVDENSWYPQQSLLNIYRDLASLEFYNMVSIGMKVPDNAPFPPDCSVEEALAVINEAYQNHHRGGDVGEYRYEPMGEREARIICRNPYPSDFDYGVIYRLVQKYMPADSRGVTLVRDESAPNRKKGGDSCTFIAKW